MYPAVLLMYFISAAVILLASLALMVQDSLPYKKTGRASVLYNFILVLDKLIQHTNIVDCIKAQRLSWFGHVQRMPDTRTIKKIFKWKSPTKRSQGRLEYRWEDNIKQDICQMKIKNWIACVQDRGKRKDVVGKTKSFNL